MTRKSLVVLVLALGAVSMTWAQPATVPFGGDLRDGRGQPVADGAYRMRFTIFAGPTSGTALWEEVEPAVLVRQGFFTATLGDTSPLDLVSLYPALWVETALDADMSGGFEPGEIYASRQLLAGAIRAINADMVGGLPPSLLGTITAVAAGPGLLGGGTDGAVTLSVAFAGSGLAATAARSDHSHAQFATLWSLFGNAGTSPTLHFLGTTDAKPLEFRVNNQRALRIEPASPAPNLIGGFRDNRTSAGVTGAMIGGGGNTRSANIVSDNFGVVAGGQNNVAGDTSGTVANAPGATIGGGIGNRAGGRLSTIAGGQDNRTQREFSFIGGGLSNVASGFRATVVGGQGNVASGFGANIAGGQANISSGTQSMIPGGVANVAGGKTSLAAGRRAKALHEGAFVWADNTEADFVSSGPNQFLIRAGAGVGINTNATSGFGLRVAGAAGLNGELNMAPDGSPARITNLAAPTAASDAATKNYVDAALSAGGWLIGGNAGLTSGTHFLGTTDAVPLDLRTSNTRVLRIEPTAVSPNLIGGFAGNVVTSGVFGATIAGGGAAGSEHQVRADFGTIGGGERNVVDVGAHATVGGGQNNRTIGVGSTIAGGRFNRSNVEGGTVGGGRNNVISGQYDMIGGGENNSATGLGSTVAGGRTNKAQAEAATVGGGRDNEALAVASTVAGGSRNRALGLSGSTVGGGVANVSSGTQTTIAGGAANNALGGGSTISGGNSNNATGIHCTVGGGIHNVSSGTFYVTVGGGGFNKALASFSTIAGGLQNTAFRDRATVGGGVLNVSSGTASTISGGNNNTALGTQSTIAGGAANKTFFQGGTVGGGVGNNAHGQLATIAGGTLNDAIGFGSAIAGGRNNATSATGAFAAIPGGELNTVVRSYGLASGRRAKANHQGAFVWADSTNLDFPSTAHNQFSARSVGGVRFVTAISAVTGAPTAGVQLAAGGTGWLVISDRELKENFAPVDSRAILKQVAAMPIQTWNMKSQEASIRHIGPMAQDFRAAFGLGEDERYINSIDADGVALAAIQGLNDVVKEKSAEIQSLRARLAEQERRNAELTRRLDALEKMLPAPSAGGEDRNR